MRPLRTPNAGATDSAARSAVSHGPARLVVVLLAAAVLLSGGVFWLWIARTGTGSSTARDALHRPTTAASDASDGTRPAPAPAASAAPAATPTAPAPAAEAEAAPVPLGSRVPGTSDLVVLREHPHPPSAFTQGLALSSAADGGDGAFYEGTGLYGESVLRRVPDIATGAHDLQRSLAKQHFGEGVTVWGDRIWQLTWHEHVCYVYDRKSLRVTHRLKQSFEGWGLTHDTTHLIASDGSDKLYFLQPDTLTLQRTVHVTERVANGQRRPVTRINELEYAFGVVYANIWYSDKIALINPHTGAVVHWLRVPAACYPAAGPKSRHQRPADAVANGIAIDAAAVPPRMWVTGKWWPKLFEVKFEPVLDLVAASIAAESAKP